ncbi:MAG TPA: PilN domain-containing protein, partial [Casimicrobiaceae bacterium]|nr:PilN domain-containing protein [Casimicrobiaceae bacterium]
PSLVQVLEDITKTLPDDTWLTQLDVRGGTRGKEARRELLLRGESANAGRLVSLLEDSKAFVEAAPRSPTTKIQPGPGEIFDLGALVAPVPPPPTLELVSSTATAGAAAPAAPVPATPPAAASAVAPSATPPVASPAPQTAAPAPAVAGAAAPAPPVAIPPQVPPGSVQPPAASAPPTTVVNGQRVVSPAIPGTAPPSGKAP